MKRKRLSTGFTLIELLVVIAIIAVLAALLLPAVGRAKQRAQLAQCLSNFRQLQVAWQMHASDHDDYAVSPPPTSGWAEFKISVAVGWYKPAWTQGRLSYEPNNFDNFDIGNLVNPERSAFGDYITTAGVYRCPGDRSTALWQGQSKFRVRSYNYNWEFSTLSSGKRFYGVRVDTVRNPSKTFTFIEQHEDSLEHAEFFLPFDVSDRILADIPGGRHGRTSAVGFVDGHVETKKWVDPRTIPPVLGEFQKYSPSAVSNNPDLDWLAERRVKF